VGYYEVEVVPGTREKSLQLYGEAWDCLDNPRLHASVSEVLFKFVTVERIVEMAAPLIHVRTRPRTAQHGAGWDSYSRPDVGHA
jgi:hypothetical protein